MGSVRRAQSNRAEVLKQEDDCIQGPQSNWPAPAPVFRLEKRSNAAPTFLNFLGAPLPIGIHGICLAQAGAEQMNRSQNVVYIDRLLS